MTQEMFDASIPERYAKALSDLSAEQAALLMSTQGLSNEQIRQALAARTLEGSTETLTVVQQYQAMANAGLLKSKQTLTTAEVTEALQTTLGADADAEAALAAMGLATATDAEGNSTVKLTAKKLQATVADGVLTEAQAQQLGMTLGVTAAVNTQANSTLPKWIVSLKASALVIWENVKATAAWLATSPVGWCILAGTAVFSLVKIVDALTVSLDEATNALEDAQNNYDTAKSQVESYSSQIKDLTDRINELQKLADNGTISVTEQEELDSLKAQNEELDRNIRLQEEKQRLAQQYETARLQAQEYGKQINELNANYLAGKYSATEYAEKLADLTQNQYDAINAYRDAEDAIMDVNKSRVDIMTDAINKETEAYNELIQAKLDALSAEKDLYEYRNSISEKNKSITDIERQLAAISNDDSTAAKAQKAKLQEQLDEARKDLADYEYDYDIEQRQDALNKEKDDYEKSQQQRIDSLNAYLENRDQVISDSFESVKANTSTVADELTQIAQEHGVKISNTITSAWNQGSNAIASYGQTLSAQSSVFLGNLLTVQNGIYALSAEANNTANSLGYMFSTSANTLLSELQSSYNSVGNVNTASQALKDSLVNTLERGYNINSITKGLNSIADSASSAASSVRDLNNALSGGSGGGSGSYASDSNNRAEDHYRIVDPRYKKSKESKYILVDNLRDDATLRKYMEKYRDQLHSGNLIIQRYAKGGIVTKEKDNPFNAIAQSVGEDTMIAAKEGESVLTKDQTKGIQSLAENISKPNRTDPITINGKTYYKVTDYDIPLKKLDEQISQMKADGIDTDSWLKSMTMNKHMFYMDTDLPTIEKTTVQQPVNIQVGNMVEVQGSLDSATMPQVKKAIDQGINNLGVKLTKQLRYGGT